MKFTQHCRNSSLIYGSSFPGVHLWLDGDCRHSVHTREMLKKRHHQAGIAYVKAVWGLEAARAALDHIRSDLESYYKVPVPEIPLDSLEYDSFFENLSLKTEKTIN